MATGNKSKTEDARRHRKELAREERLKGRQEAQARRAQRDRMVYAGLAVVVAAIVAALAWAATRPKAPLPGVEYPDQGGEHIPRGQPHPAYNSNPPTSGWHNPEAAPPGAFRDEVPDEIAIHNLEHGCIWISYKDPKDTDLVTKLEDLAAKYPATVLLTVRSKNDSPIAVAAWRRLLKLDKFDEGQIEGFIKIFRNKGPEAVNCVGAMPPR